MVFFFFFLAGKGRPTVLLCPLKNYHLNHLAVDQAEVSLPQTQSVFPLQACKIDTKYSSISLKEPQSTHIAP